MGQGVREQDREETEEEMKFIILGMALGFSIFLEPKLACICLSVYLIMEINETTKTKRD